MPARPAAGALDPNPALPGVERGRVTFGPFVLDGRGAQLLREGVAVSIAPKTLAVLEFLAGRPGALVTKDELLDGV